MRVAEATARNRFGKYSLVAKLATGGMAEIFLARLEGAADFTKLVCVKRILPHLAKELQLVNMFLSEARIAAQISHPNVCQVFELGEIEGSYFIAMEYLEGVPLSCFRRRDMYPAATDPRLIAALGIQACEGLHHAHQLKRPDGSPLEVVHRDVSSNNLFATVDGVVKVLDFGIAKVQDASVRTTTGSVKGTYAYMAPEQLRGEVLDRRTDVFAMGIVLWELFARRHLFRRDTDYLTFQAITSDPIPDVRELRADAPPALAAVIAQALERDRTRRFPTARVLGDALREAVAAQGGPLTGGQLSDEIARAFEARLRDQQTLIRVAREGGALDLEEVLGPSVGHGTAMVTTPVSILSNPGAPVAIGARELERSGGAVNPAAVAAPGPRSLTLPVQPLPAPPEQRSRLPAVLLVLIALGGSAAAVYFYLEGKRLEEAPQVRTSGGGGPEGSQYNEAPRGSGGPEGSPYNEAPRVRRSGSGGPEGSPYNDAPRGSGGPEGSPHNDTPPERVVMSPTPPVIGAREPAGSAIPAVDAVSSAAAAPGVVDAAIPSVDAATAVAAAPQDAAATRPDTRPLRPPPPARPSGPPGFITIDSSPVYAVIYIDGKRIGETPLVQIELAPGKHSVRAMSPSGSMRSLAITIESGKVAPTRRIEW